MGTASGFDTQKLVERVKGIEPSYSAWEADVLPLNYTRRLCLKLLKALFKPYVHPFAVRRRSRRDLGVTFT